MCAHRNATIHHQSDIPFRRTRRSSCRPHRTLPRPTTDHHGRCYHHSHWCRRYAHHSLKLHQLHGVQMHQRHRYRTHHCRRTHLRRRMHRSIEARPPHVSIEHRLSSQQCSCSSSVCRLLILPFESCMATSNYLPITLEFHPRARRALLSRISTLAPSRWQRRKRTKFLRPLL